MTPLTNDAFLGAIFNALPVDQSPWACMFPGHPDEEREAWRGYPWVAGMGLVDSQDANAYFTLATYRIGTTRSGANCARIYGLMLDDVGTPKSISLDALTRKLAPSVVTETSPGNFQVIYLFDSPLEGAGLDIADRIHAAVRKAGLCDPNAGSAPTRYLRLPHAVNGKYMPPWRCRLTVWQPVRRYTPTALVEGLGLDLSREATKHDPSAAPEEWMALTVAEQDMRTSDVRGALEVIPADDRAMWIKVGQGLKASFPDSLGRGLWDEWSEGSVKFDADDQERTWVSLRPTNIDYRALFNVAKANGWVNPRNRPDVDTTKLGFGVGVTLPPDVISVAISSANDGWSCLDLASLADVDPPPPTFWWGRYLPAGELTLLAAHGGTGKSTLVLELAVSIALGHDAFGRSTKRGRVLVLSAEDPSGVLAYRLKAVARRRNVSFSELGSWLRVEDATADPVLYAGDRTSRKGAPTARYQELAGLVQAGRFEVVIVDNASDTYAGDEIDRSQVRDFVRKLTATVRPRGGAVLLLAHVSKGTSRAGRRPEDDEGYSGSTAWHNSSRSRLFMFKVDEETIEIQHQKSNFGRPEPPMRLRWIEGGGLAAISVPPEGALLELLMACVAAALASGQRLAPSKQSGYAAVKMLKHRPEYPQGLDDKAAWGLLEKAEATGLLVRASRRDEGRNLAEVYALPAQPLVA